MSYKIVINAGHGIKNNGIIDVGAVGVTGYQEYIETAEVSKLVCEKLKYNGIEVLYIQDGDLWDITNQANSWGADYFISVHCNSFDANAHGIETFAYSSGGKGEVLARSIQNELLFATGLYDRKVKFANYHVLRETNMPAVLTEIGFISNPKEESLMKDSVWDNKVAIAIAKGICNFLKLEFKENNNNNQGDDFQMEYAVLGFSLNDLGACMLISQKYGNCAIYFRNSDKTFNQDCLKAKILFVVGGTSVGHKNEKLLSGLTAKDTLQEVLNVL